MCFEFSMSKPKILIVDDDIKISALLHVFLEKAGGYEVREENRSFAALATAREYRPDLALLDVDMPGKSGGEVAGEFADDPLLASVPILFVTSLLSGAEARTKGIVRGGQLFLSKPVDPHALLRAVRGLLNPASV
jgi:two-component system OmpR family response regulator